MYTVLLAILLTITAAYAQVIDIASAVLAHDTDIDLVSRQVSLSNLTSLAPAACQSTCKPIEPIYSSCVEVDLNACMAMCVQRNYDMYWSCLQCTITENSNNGQTYSAARVAGIRASQRLLASGCKDNGTPIITKDFNIPGAKSGGALAISPALEALGLIIGIVVFGITG